MLSIVYAFTALPVHESRFRGAHISLSRTQPTTSALENYTTAERHDNAVEMPRAWCDRDLRYQI